MHSAQCVVNSGQQGTERPGARAGAEKRRGDYRREREGRGRGGGALVGVLPRTDGCPWGKGDGAGVTRAGLRPAPTEDEPCTRGGRPSAKERPYAERDAISSR